MEGVGEPGAVPAAADDVTVRDLIGSLAGIRPCADSASLINQLRALEDLKSGAAALQARIAVAFDVRECRAQAEAGVPAKDRCSDVAAQIALARGESPVRGGRLP